MSSSLTVRMGWWMGLALLLASCRPAMPPTTQPAASTQPEATTQSEATTQPGAELAGAATQAEEPALILAARPVLSSQAEREIASYAAELGVGRGKLPAIEVVGAPAPPPAAVDQANADGTVTVGLPPGAKAEFTMPGKGTPPALGPEEVRQRAAYQAAIFAAIYNVTKEINPESSSQPIEDGFVNSDHFRYKTGLEVKSQTVVFKGRVKQFDIWLIVPKGDKPDQPAFEAHVRNFALDGEPLGQEKLNRLMAAGGGHLAVTQMTGPDAQGGYTAEVGLVRKGK